MNYRLLANQDYLQQMTEEPALLVRTYTRTMRSDVPIVFNANVIIELATPATRFY